MTFVNSKVKKVINIFTSNLKLEKTLATRVLTALDALRETGKVPSDRQFALKIGINPTQISNMRKGTRTFPSKYIDKIVNIFPINRVWLETGNGEMFIQKGHNPSDNHLEVSRYTVEKDYGNNIVTKQNGPFSTEMFAPEELEYDAGKQKGIPMYNMPASASNVEMYADASDLRIVGFLNIPGASKGSFALPVHGHSMYPTLANGYWGVVRPISDPTDIDWGQVYFVEYGDYMVWKRLIKDEADPENVILWSDNQTELVGSRPKYSPKTIRADRIKRLCLLTDILHKPNF